jgi:hypothetical protein
MQTDVSTIALYANAIAAGRVAAGLRRHLAKGERVVFGTWVDAERRAYDLAEQAYKTHTGVLACR